MTLTIPELSLVVLIGPLGCGKSTFARKHFMPTEVMSSDGFRALMLDDENDQSSTDDAFAALHFVAGRRLARAKLTVIDATTSRRVAQAARCTCAGVSRAPRRDRPGSARAHLPRAESIPTRS